MQIADHWQQDSERLLITAWGYPPHIRPEDLDVRMATLDDFGGQVSQGLWFIESTKLCTIASRVSELRAERRQIRAEDHANVDSSLKHWIADLPMDLRLFDPNGDRNAYSRHVSELAIQYFVTIITNEFLRYRERPPGSQGIITSLVAGSCGTILYDEILARDDMISLPHTHGFFCLALALPLLHYVPESVTRAATRVRDIEVLRSVLSANTNRWGDATLYIRMMDQLKIHTSRPPRHTENSGEMMQQQATLEAQQLFPFPHSFCDSMDLLDPPSCANELFSINDFVIPDDGFLDLTWLESMGTVLDNVNFEDAFGT